MKTWLLTLLTGILLGHASGLFFHARTQGQPRGASPPAAADPVPEPLANAQAAAPATPTAPLLSGLSAEEQRDIRVFHATAPSVVYISNVSLRRDYFSLNVMEIPQGTGSGFVWDQDGHIVTNYHVIQSGSRFTRYRVVFDDQSDWEAQLVGVAPDKDLAVLRIEAPHERLQPIHVGSSAGLQVGQRVFAIGNPFGLDHSLTIGVVSALGRELDSPGGRRIRDVVQTDAAINPGNSGGPLLDSSGRLVGVNTAIYSPSGGSAGIGFAVPVDTVKRLVPQLIAYGKPQQPGIGFTLLADRYAARWDLEGVIVRGVQPRGPADLAGIEGLSVGRDGRLRMGDRVVAVDRQPITSTDDLFHVFEEAGVGAEVTLTLMREDRRREVVVRLIPIE